MPGSVGALDADATAKTVPVDAPAALAEAAGVKAETVDPPPPPPAVAPAVAEQPVLPVADPAPVVAPAVPGPQVLLDAAPAPKARARGRPRNVNVPVGECKLCWPREHSQEPTRGFGHDVWCPGYRGKKGAA